MKPVLLDIGCCQGGAARGYQHAGFYVVGVDTRPQPRYIGDEFIQADGFEILVSLRNDFGWFELINGQIVQPAAVHTSWPCQGYTECQRIQGREHPKLIESGRELLDKIGLPYVQENVDSAETRQVMKDPVMLCGAAFGLHTYRHRLFESNITLTAPEHPQHLHSTVKMGRPLQRGDWYHAVGNFSNVPWVREDLGCDWMTRDGLRECVPPAYTEYLGRHLLRAVAGQVSAGLNETLPT